MLPTLRKPRCLIGCSGSVATLKVPSIVNELADCFEVVLVCTNNSYFFLNKAVQYDRISWAKFEELGGLNLVYRDDNEWDQWDKIGDEVVHIQLRRWADIFIVAPASANIIAKASQGICDNLLLSVMRAWDFNKPCVLCPAMNTVMWEHPATKPALDTLRTWGWKVVGPVKKKLACNDVGNGGMSPISDIKPVLLSNTAHLNNCPSSLAIKLPKISNQNYRNSEAKASGVKASKNLIITNHFHQSAIKRFISSFFPCCVIAATASIGLLVVRYILFDNGIEAIRGLSGRIVNISSTIRVNPNMTLVCK